MLLLEKTERAALWGQLLEALEAYTEGVAAHRVTPEMDPAQVRAYLGAVDFDRPLAPGAALQFVLEGLWQFQTHTPHPNYYGLFNPAPATMSIAGDVLAAAFNPQRERPRAHLTPSCARSASLSEQPRRPGRLGRSQNGHRELPARGFLGAGLHLTPTSSPGE